MMRGKPAVVYWSAMQTKRAVNRYHTVRHHRLPASLRPLLWSLRWSALDAREDREDIIVNVINEGTMAQWRWLVATYGKPTIRRVLARRLASEFHPESRALAHTIFGSTVLRHARRRTHH